MLNTLYDTTIGTLRVRGPRADQDAVQQDLQRADWPEAPGQQVVFVRRLKVSQRRDQIRASLLQEARHCVLSGNDPNQVMRFANTQHMLATLLSDLARGDAGRRWYWQRWRQLIAMPVSQALYSVLADHPEQINALTEHLSQQQTLPLVWRRLTEADALQLWRELCWHNGYRDAETTETSAPTATTPNAERHGITHRSNNIAATIPRSVLQRWQPVLVAHTAQCHRVRLAALLLAQECCPISLQHSVNHTVDALITTLTDTAYRALATAPTEPPVQGTPVNTHTPTGSDTPTAGTPPTNMNPQHSSPTAVQSTAAIPAGKQPLSAKATGPAQTTAQEITQVQGTGSRQGDPGAATDQPVPTPPAAQSMKVDLHSTAADHCFHTRQGGVFYLLNFLNRPAMQTIMGDYWQDIANGWIWLYRVAERLQLDVQDPVARFLAQQLGFDHSDALQSLPALPAAERITTLAQQWYGAADLWQPSLLMLPARVHYSASHVDMHVAANHVQLELRLAGLDINPGWLPWLGRVVQFHFDRSEATPNE